MVIDDIFKKVTSILPIHEKSIALHEPYFCGDEWSFVKECIDTGWVSSAGKYVDAFEKNLSDFTGCENAIATSNGTSALHICYLLAGVTTNDEVLVPTVTFVATTNAIRYCGAIPHFIDCEEKSLGIDPVILENYLNEITIQENNICKNKITGRTIRALCVMHTIGHPVDLDPILAICQKFHIVLIEDAAEALGSYYKGKHVGQHGLLSSLSFNGNKIITTGGGGAILTNDRELAKRAKHITTTAKTPHAWAFEHDEVAYNYRLPNLNAALGCAQLAQLDRFLAAKRKLSNQYHYIFSDLKQVRLIQEPVQCQSNYWLNAIVLDSKLENERDRLLELFIQHGIMVRPLWNLQHTLPMYHHCPRMPLPIAESLVKRIIKLPSGPQLILKKGSNHENSHSRCATSG